MESVGDTEDLAVGHEFSGVQDLAPQGVERGLAQLGRAASECVFHQVASAPIKGCGQPFFPDAPVIKPRR